MLSASLYQPIQFFSITLLATWAPWFIAAYYSYQSNMESFQLLFMIPGLVAPCVTAMSMIYGSKNRELINDFWNKLSISRINLNFFVLIVLLMPSILFLATAISLLFGQSTDQFSLSSEYEVMKGWNLLGLVISLFLAPLLEELGWRGYGVDSLRAHFNLFITSILFACLWGLWHLPLFFINGYYQHELLDLGTIYVINFFVSIFPAGILTNWIYYKNHRSIVAVILFHTMMNASAVFFRTEQFTKCIITLLLCVVSVIVVVKNKKFFFHKEMHTNE